MRVSILHPFTAAAAGVVEKSIPVYHSQPHVWAMYNLISKDYECSMEYLTNKLLKYNLENEGLIWRFYPVDFKFNGDHKKWKKQYSKSCLKTYYKETPDVTFINMSGHSSPFSHELAKLILKKRKAYVPMLGGQHYSDTPGNREYYKNAHHIIVHTHLQRKEMLKMEMFKGKDISVYPLGVDCDIFKPKETTKEKTNPELLYVGRIIEWKRIHIAIESIIKLKEAGFNNAHLNIIGPVYSDVYLEQLQVLIRENNLESNVTFVGYKDYKELPEFFTKADLLMLPSDKETFGMVMIEAMSCGTPVAAFNCKGGPADVITDKVNGILADMTHLENYGTRVVEFFTNENQKKELSNNARQLILNKYSLKQTSEVIENSVKSVLNSYKQ